MRKALVVAQLMVVLLIARNWAYVTTYRLYLDDRLGGGAGSAAVQRFDVEQSAVVPQIVTREPDRLAFSTDVRQDSGRACVYRGGLREAFAYYLNIYERPVDLEIMHRNRLAQNNLMRRLCDAERIPCVDMTTVFEARLQTGETYTFPTSRT
jgi:hypothetical protein